MTIVDDEENLLASLEPVEKTWVFSFVRFALTLSLFTVLHVCALTLYTKWTPNENHLFFYFFMPLIGITFLSKSIYADVRKKNNDLLCANWVVFHFISLFKTFFAAIMSDAPLLNIAKTVPLLFLASFVFVSARLCVHSPDEVLLTFSEMWNTSRDK